MADRDLANHDADLASKAQVIPGLDVRLAFIDTDALEDKYHVMQGLRATGGADDDPKCCYFYQRGGGTGTRGDISLEGPMEMPKVAKAFVKIFAELTGHELGSVEPGHRALPGKYWLQHQPTPFLEAQWQYYVSDGVDGKGAGWYPYEDSASACVEELYAQHVANAREQRTATRLVQSGYFTYHVDLEAMTQTNLRTRKVRSIRRATGEAEVAEGTGAGRVTRTPRAEKVLVGTARRPPTAAMKARATKSKSETRPMRAMKVMKKAMKKVMKKKRAMKVSRIGSRRAVFAGKKDRTRSGKKRDDFMKSKSGKIVSKRLSASCKKLFGKIAQWVAACKKARAELGLTGFVAVKKGTPLYAKAKELLPSVEPHALS